MLQRTRVSHREMGCEGPAQEVVSLNLYGFVSNSQGVDAFGLYDLQFAGPGWTTAYQNAVTEAFKELKARLPDLLAEIDKGVKEADKYPKGCEFAKALKEALEFMNSVLNKAKAGVDGNSPLPLYIDTTLGTDVGVEVKKQRKGLFGTVFPDWMFFNPNASGVNFFQYPIGKQAGNLLHEISHFSSTSDLNDKSPKQHMTGPFYQNLLTDPEIRKWFTPLSKEAGPDKKCCPQHTITIPK